MDSNNINFENWEKLLNNPKLGEILVQHRKITIPQLDEALKEQEQVNIPLGQILLQKQIITKDELIGLLELQAGISKMLSESFNELKNLNNSPEIEKLSDMLELEINSDKQ